MRGMFKERIALPAIVVVLLSGLLSGAYFISGMHASLDGTVRPELSLTSLSGHPTRLPSPFFGKHIILLFTPTCPHCRTELEHYSRLAAMNAFLPVFGISLGDHQLTDSLVRSTDLRFPVFLDGDGSVQLQFNVSRVPVILFVDEDDVIRLTLAGSRSFQEDSMLYARFARAGAPGASDVGRSEGTDIRTSPVAPNPGEVGTTKSTTITNRHESWLPLWAEIGEQLNPLSIPSAPSCPSRFYSPQTSPISLPRKSPASSPFAYMARNPIRADSCSPIYLDSCSAPTACLAGGTNSRTDPVGPWFSIGRVVQPDGPRQAAGSINLTHYS